LASRVLIIGDGLLGTELHKQTGWDLISRKKDNIDINNPGSYIEYLLDFIDDSYHGRLGYAVNYDTIINCTAYTDSYSSDPSNHLAVNYNAVGKLVDVCNKYVIKLVHISTEFVYANNSDKATERDIPNPLASWYGVSKLLGDLYVQSESENYLICRLLHKAKNLKYNDVWKVKTSGDTVDKIADLVVKLIKKEATGVYNVGTGDKHIKDIIEYNNEIEAPLDVPKDTTMNLDKLNNFLKL